MLPMSEQDYDRWVDISSGYDLDKFHDEMASKIIWEPSQEIRVWGLDTEFGTECVVMNLYIMLYIAKKKCYCSCNPIYMYGFSQMNYTFS